MRADLGIVSASDRCDRYPDRNHRAGRARFRSSTSRFEPSGQTTFDDEALTETAKDLVDRADGLLLPLLILLVVVGAPVVEEIVYRGLLQRPLLGDFPAPAVIVGVATVFSIIHFRPVEYPGLFVAGLVFGVAAWKTGRVGMAIAAHVGFNADRLSSRRCEN